MPCALCPQPQGLGSTPWAQKQDNDPVRPEVSHSACPAGKYSSASALHPRAEVQGDQGQLWHLETTPSSGSDGVRTLGQPAATPQPPSLHPGATRSVLHVPVPHVVPVIYTLTCRAFYRSIMTKKSFMFIHAHHNPAFFILCADLPAHLVSLSVLPRELPEPSS